MDSTLFHRLFIIGNGFDSAHGYKTRYFHFRNWMEDKLKEAYPSIETDGDGHVVLGEDPEIPFVIMGHHGDEIVDENQSLYLLMWMLLLQMKSDDDWNKFEDELYYLDLDAIIDINDWSIEESARDKDGDINPFHADVDYSNMASDLRASVMLLPKLFKKWIEDIEIFDVTKLPISMLMDEECLYLTFNYTETLEKIYGIPGYLIDHIHGLRQEAEEYYDSDSPFPNTIGAIIVGHGEDLSRYFNDTYIGRESILQETIQDLRKPVDKILREHAEFWSYIFYSGVNEVYSFGFSYSDVDLDYVSNIIVSLHGGYDVTWYLNRFDDRLDDVDTTRTVNQKFEEIIKACGFKGKFGRYD